MKYFKLMYDYEHDDNAIFLEIDINSLIFDRYDTERGIVFETWDNNIDVIYDKSKGEVITDYIANELAWFIVTDKFKTIIESINNNNIQFLKIRAKCKNSTEELDVYLVNICNVIDALDLNNSRYRVYETGKNEKMLSIQKYAIKSDKVQGYDLFRLEGDYVSIFISERLKKCIKKNGITGCDFLEVKIT